MLVEQNVVCPVLIGRDAPLSAGWHALQRAHDTHGGTLLVSGEAGVGKSRYTAAVAERASSLGFIALQGACFETDRARPYAPLLDLVRTLASSISPALAAHYVALTRLRALDVHRAFGLHGLRDWRGDGTRSSGRSARGRAQGCPNGAQAHRGRGERRCRVNGRDRSARRDRRCVCRTRAVDAR